MLRLRPFADRDAESIVSWIQNEDIFYKWSAGKLGAYPISPLTLTQYHNENRSKDYFPMTAFDEKGIAGSLLMRFPSDDMDVLRFGFVILDDSRRGSGCGKEMISLALDYAFHILKVKTVTIGVFSDNSPALHCYLSAGFSDTGVREEYFLNGQTRECMELSITAPLK